VLLHKSPCIQLRIQESNSLVRLPLCHCDLVRLDIERSHDVMKEDVAPEQSNSTPSVKAQKVQRDEGYAQNEDIPINSRSTRRSPSDTKLVPSSVCLTERKKLIRTSNAELLSTKNNLERRYLCRADDFVETEIGVEDGRWNEGGGVGGSYVIGEDVESRSAVENSV